MSKFNIPKDRLLKGLRRLAKKQKPGQTFSYAEIAKEAGVDEKAIRKLEARALEGLKKKLSGCSPEMLQNLRAAMQVGDVHDDTDRVPVPVPLPAASNARRRKLHGFLVGAA